MRNGYAHRVLDDLIARVQAFTVDGVYRFSWSDWQEPGESLDAFGMPVGVVVAPNGYVYVSDA